MTEHSTTAAQIPILFSGDISKKKCGADELRRCLDARCSPSWPHRPGASQLSIDGPLAPTALQFLAVLLFSLRIRRHSAPPLTPFIYFLSFSLRPITSHFCTFLWEIIRCLLPPDGIYLPSYHVSCTQQHLTFALFFVDLSGVRPPP